MAALGGVVFRRGLTEVADQEYEKEVAKKSQRSMQ
jgi:hypothetical protein